MFVPNTINNWNNIKLGSDQGKIDLWEGQEGRQVSRIGLHLEKVT